jgi:hypothetical protein
VRWATLVSIAAIAGTCALGVVACSSARSLSDSPQERAADQHAVTAGNVMTQGYTAVSARDAAWRVVGHRGDTTIDALVADGTNRSGRIVLRISVDNSDGSEFDSTATRCYQYSIDWAKGQTGSPARLGQCPNAPALALSLPTVIDVISQSATARLLRTLDTVGPTQRRDGSLIEQKVTVLYPAPATVAVGPTNSGDLEVTIRAGDECSFALVPVSGKPSMIGTGQGLDCQS